jgi:hypothetical protein
MERTLGRLERDAGGATVRAWAPEWGAPACPRRERF